MRKIKTNQYVTPSREQQIRSMITSTVIETGQDARRLEQELSAKRKKYPNLKLAN